MILLPYVLQLSVTLMNRLKGVCVGGGGLSIFHALASAGLLTKTNIGISMQVIFYKISIWS